MVSLLHVNIRNECNDHFQASYLVQITSPGSLTAAPAVLGARIAKGREDIQCADAGEGRRAGQARRPVRGWIIMWGGDAGKRWLGNLKRHAI